jgi:hypothetical protein
MEHGEAFKILDERHWCAEVNKLGMWAVGPEDEAGLLNILGLAPDLEGAVQMALRSAEKV